MANTLDIKIPALGESIREAVIAKWLKQPGDHAADGEIVAELETDKVTVELRAPAAGVMGAHRFAAGDTVQIGDVVGSIEPGAAPQKTTAAATAAAAATETKAKAKPEASAPLAPAKGSNGGGAVLANVPVAAVQQPAAAENAAAPAAVQQGDPAHDANGDHLHAILNRPASPSLRKALRENGLDPEARPAQAAPAATAPAPVAAQQPAPTQNPATQQSNAATQSDSRETIVPMSPLRRRIAERLVQAQHSAASLTTFNEVDMSSLMALRERFKETFLAKHGVKLGLMSFFTRAVLAALKDYPGVNAELRDGDGKTPPAVIYKQHYDIGIAVGSGKGLVVPVVRDADRLSFAEIEKRVAEYGKKAKENKLTVEELQGGTFTITNGGVYGSMMSTPLLNYPQTGILGMHNTLKRAVVVNDKVEVRPMMYVALTYDHRVVDGREAVQFLVGVKERVENPERLMFDL